MRCEEMKERERRGRGPHEEDEQAGVRVESIDQRLTRGGGCGAIQATSDRGERFRGKRVR
jgi:hypothetical protein